MIHSATIRYHMRNKRRNRFLSRTVSPEAESDAQRIQAVASSRPRPTTSSSPSTTAACRAVKARLLPGAPACADHYLIHYVAERQGHLCGERRQPTRLRSGRRLSWPSPAQLITYTADQEDPWEYYWVGFNGASANTSGATAALSWRTRPPHTCKNA